MSNTLRLLEMIEDRTLVYWNDIPADLHDAWRIARQERWIECRIDQRNYEQVEAYRQSLNIAYWLTEQGRVALALLRESAKPVKRKTGRRTTTEKPADTETLAWLCKWHGYDESSVTNDEPATNRKLHKFVSERLRRGERGIAPNALSRFLAKRGGIKNYKVKCCNGTIGTLLSLWLGDAPNRLAGLLAHESGREDDE
jgi:hypothetical protein